MRLVAKEMESFGKMMKPLGLALVIIVVASSAFAAASDTTPAVGNSNSNRKMKSIPPGLLLVGYTEANCITKGEPCGLFDHCCSHLYCTSAIQGACICVGEGDVCGLMHSCCEGLSCTGAFSGQCIKVVLNGSPWEKLGSAAYAP